MKITAAIAFLAGVLCLAVAYAPACDSSSPSLKVGGMLMQGCQ